MTRKNYGGSRGRPMWLCVVVKRCFVAQLACKRGMLYTGVVGVYDRMDRVNGWNDG